MMKINYYNFSKFNDGYLVTNDLGEYCFLDAFEMDALNHGMFSEISDLKVLELKDKSFIYEVDDDVFIEKVKESYRNIKSYLFESTSLHIFVLTNKCNLNCVYCQARDPEHDQIGIMDYRTAEKAVDVAFQSPSLFLTFEFQGGEPLINYNTLKHIVEYAESKKDDRTITYTVVTNTFLLTDEMIEFFKDYNFEISTSLDGNKQTHDANRPDRRGKGTYEKVVESIAKLRENYVGVGAIQTTTKNSLSYAREIVRTYMRLGFHHIFLRPLTPLGYARDHWDEIGYAPGCFVEFYREALDEIINANKQGYKMAEGYAVIFLRKILFHESDNFMELRSPCGAGVGQMAYYYDGKIYTCDEGRMLAEMGLPDFCIGNVNMTYDEMMESKVCKITCQASVLEGMPRCCDCVYHPYCGVCPVVNFAMDKSIYARRANGYKCIIYKGILDILFEYLKQDYQAVEIFRTWL